MAWLDWFFSLITLIILEIILGVDNLILLSILTERLPVAMRKKARRWGLTFAWITRLGLLGSAVWLVKLTNPLFVMGTFGLSIRDLFLLIGGLFLIVKATQEIHREMEGEDDSEIFKKKEPVSARFLKIVLQVAIMDIIFSLDSVLTAIGLTDQFLVMALAISIAIIVMIWASEPVSVFIEMHPTIKMLALSFLILVGTVLIADGLKFHVPRAYVYFAMGFSLGVESLNLIKHKKQKRTLKKR